MRSSLHRAIVMGGALALALASAAPAYAQNGQQTYVRCSACHLPTGVGVLGSYPSLQTDARTLARRADGRRYLIQAVTRGLSGPITVNGKTYRGTMPIRSGLDDAAVAGVLTYVTGTLGKDGPAPKPFTAAEVKAARTAGASLTSIAVAKSRPAVK